jgi:hypothetical protein
VQSGPIADLDESDVGKSNHCGENNTYLLILFFAYMKVSRYCLWFPAAEDPANAGLRNRPSVAIALRANQLPANHTG